MPELFYQTIQISKKFINDKGIIFMKKICTFLIALLLILSSLAIGSIQFAEAASFRTVKVVNGSSLVVKAFPTTSASTVATLSRGDFVTVFSISNGWSFIQYGNVTGLCCIYIYW